MAKIKHTKTELKAQTDALKRFQRFLPMLQLKKQQLQAEIAGISAKLAEVQQREAAARKRLEAWVALYSDDGSDALAVMLSIKGYDSSNPMSVAVGFDGEGKIIKCSVISCNGETKGIGSKVADENLFLSRFYNLSNVSGVDTISGATISSSAFKAAMADACKVVERHRGAEVEK